MRAVLVALLLLSSTAAFVLAAPSASACTNDHCNGGPCRITYTDASADPNHPILLPSGLECGPS